MSDNASTKRPGSVGRSLTRLGASVHGFMYRRGMGQVQTVLLTTIGRKSGQPHTVPLGAIPEGDGWIVIGSNGGKDVDPGWWLNMTQTPTSPSR